MSSVAKDDWKQFEWRVTNPIKFSDFMHTIESFEDYVDPIQEAIDDLLLPTLFGQTEPLPSDLRQLLTLTPAAKEG